MTTLAGKTAFVTGGSRGIGLAVAKALLAQGAAVVITGTDQGRLDSAAKALAADKLLPVRCDVRNYAEVQAAMSKAIQRFGGLDILVNNAGVGVFKPVAETTVEE